jgi:hypothetical protein
LFKLAASPNSIVNIAPITRFYIGAFTSSVGTTIQTSSVSKVAADINFSAHPGMFFANVVQKANGVFDVQYYNNAASLNEAIAARRASGPLSLNAKVRQAL